MALELHKRTLPSHNSHVLREELEKQIFGPTWPTLAEKLREPLSKVSDRAPADLSQASVVSAARFPGGFRKASQVEGSLGDLRPRPTIHNPCLVLDISVAELPMAPIVYFGGSSFLNSFRKLEPYICRQSGGDFSWPFPNLVRSR
jgi:hypothetical protein